nr:MAG TPA: hypothetical protein [Caudoviricetes sp.]
MVYPCLIAYNSFETVKIIHRGNNRNALALRYPLFCNAKEPVLLNKTGSFEV